MTSNSISSSSSSLQTHQQTNRLDFLFEAGHTMFSSCPSLSRYYMSEFQNTLTEYELTAHKPIARISCKSCGQINVPGLNHRIEIIHLPSKNKKTCRKKNTIKSTCLTCGNTSFYHGSYKKKMPKLHLQQAPMIAAATANATATSTATAVSGDRDTPSLLKKKKNKGKKNNLKALLSKQQTNNNSSSGGLGDFLSGL